MKPLTSHLLLVNATTEEKARLQVQDFFKHTLLVRYDRIEIVDKKCCSAASQEFLKDLKEGLEVNRSVLKRFINELKGTGYNKVDDLAHVEHGYPSKLLHIITHFLDGFIGIDTQFYNLIDDSHWVPDTTFSAIAETPDHFWLIGLNCFSESPDKAGLIQQ